MDANWKPGFRTRNAGRWLTGRWLPGRWLPGRCVLLAYAAAALASLVPSQAAHAGSFRVVATFSDSGGRPPEANLFAQDHFLYGALAGIDATPSPGSIYRFDVLSGKIEILHDLDLATGDIGTLPQRTQHIFAIGTKIGVYKAVAADSEQAQGAIDIYDPANGQYQSNAVSFFDDSRQGLPVPAMHSYRGGIVGTIGGYGSSVQEQIFNADPLTGQVTPLYTFGSSPPGYTPSGALLSVGSSLIGTMSDESSQIYAVNLGTSTLRVLHSFSIGNDGAAPVGDVLHDHSTNDRFSIIGVTALGGKFGSGTIYRLNTVTGAFKVIHSFDPANEGSLPTQGLLFYAGAYYGVLSEGGPSAGGTLFRFDGATGSFTVLHGFSSTDGQAPQSITRISNVIYGITNRAGKSGVGSIFAYRLTQP